MANISHKLSNSFEGALAGGGDPATSPLYVFGPFLKLIVVAGVAGITFGTTVWLAVLTVIMVSAMYRRVMVWVTDGSGGSGLSEEEFGGWAVKVNAAITFIEYTLTFLVSMAALVTFVADRIPSLNQTFLGLQYRTFLAIGLSMLTGWLVNRGPKMAARAFGPATAAVLLLLWVMIFASVWQLGLRLPDINLKAFTPEYLHFTLGSYARILALMTGIEIFANLVAAYEGNRQEKSRKAFGSLLIIMGTTSLTMLIVGPAIFQLSDPTNTQVSVFTQTMDQLLPSAFSYLGTLIGIAVLLSASAASAQGLQNLALGLRYRHYVPASIGQRNKFDVADKPVWIEVVLVSVCFLLFGTHEETYLALYAAGVFILLSMTGWAATKRLGRELRSAFSFRIFATIGGTALAALLTSGATLIIFVERFFEGTWTYLFFIPTLYFAFTYYRRKLGSPNSVEDRLGRVVAEKRYLPTVLQASTSSEIKIKQILAPLDTSSFAEQALPTARQLAHAHNATLTLAAVDNESRKETANNETNKNMIEERNSENRSGTKAYLNQVTSLLKADGLKTNLVVLAGETADEIVKISDYISADLIIISTKWHFGIDQLISGSVAKRVLQQTTKPMLLIRSSGKWTSRRSQFKRILVSLDGSEISERVLPYLRLLAKSFSSEVLLLSVPEGSESETYLKTIKQYLEDVAEVLRGEGITVNTMVTGSGPARTILAVSETENTDLIMMATHGRGGVERLNHVTVGSVADRVVQDTVCPVFLVPLRE